MPCSSTIGGAGVQASLAPCPGHHCVVWFEIPPPSQTQLFSACGLTHLISSPVHLEGEPQASAMGVQQVHFDSGVGTAGMAKSR